MSDLRAYQPSFVAGVLTPSLHGRVDLSKYQSGLKTGRNVIIRPEGGGSNRAGLEFVREVKSSANNARLVPFSFNTDQTYILEFGDKYFRVYRDGGIILNGGSPYEVVTPYAHDDLERLVFTGEGDVMYIIHTDYAVRKLSRLADDNWTLVQMTFAPSISAPTNLAVTARFKFRSGNSANYKFNISSIDSSDRESGASSDSNAASWQHEHFDGQYIRVSWDSVVGAVTYRVYIADTFGPGPVGFVAETSETFVDFPPGPGAFSGDGDTPDNDPGALSAPSNVTASVEFGQPNKYKVSSIDENTGEESLPSSAVTGTNELGVAGNENILSWNAVTGASAYVIYREDNGVYGYIGRSETTSFTDNNITPDISDGPQQARDPFSGAGNFPRCVTFVDQRLAFAGTDNEPQGVWLSQSGNYENFNVSSPAKASDAVTFRLRSRQINEIRSMLPMRGLMLLTSGAEWVVSGGQEGAITPSAISVDNQGFRGAAEVQPITVGNVVLFAQARGAVIRDFSYEFANDGFTGKDRTVLARHFFNGRTIKAWAYAQAPDSVVWVVLDNGSLVSMTYVREHDIWAWTEHDSAGGVFEEVAVVAEGDEDVPYFIVRRTINSATKRYIERLHTRRFASIEDAFFIDSGLTYDGTPATIITGLDHLDGEEIVALADGNVVRGLTVGAVTGGIGIELQYAASKVHVGLSYESPMETLDLDLGQVRGGTVQGRKKSVSEVVLKVKDTRGIWIGPDANSLVEWKQRATEDWGEAIQPFTGNVSITPHWDWNEQGGVHVVQKDPLPMTILAIAPDVTIGG